MKVVVDTNVVISGIFWAGPPGRILELWASGLFDVCVSSTILEEYFEVIDRIGVKCDRPTMARKWKAYLFEHCEMVETTYQYDGCRDVDDNKFVECAVTVSAAYIASGDADLLSLGSIEGVQILTPAEFLINVNPSSKSPNG